MTQTIPAARDQGWQRIRRSLGALVAIALLGTTACSSGSDTSTGPADNGPTGIYSLRKVDGKPIPSEVLRTPSRDPDTDVVIDLVVQVTGGEIILSDDGSFRLAVDYAFRLGRREERAPDQLDGAYEITGNTIAFNDGTVTGTLRNGDITVQLPDISGRRRTFVYHYVP